MVLPDLGDHRLRGGLAGLVDARSGPTARAARRRAPAGVAGRRRSCRARPARRAIATRSMAPRTLEPRRSSGCARVARVIATASATSRVVGAAGAHRDDVALPRRRPGSRRRGGTSGRRRESEIRAVPTLSNGFIDASTRNVGCRGDHADPGHRDLPLGHRAEQHVERVLGRPVELLDVEEPAALHRLHQRAGHEVVRAVVLAQHPGRVVVADQPGRRQLGVALDQHERHAPVGR